MSRTQKQIVLDLLVERGERGVSAREAIYDLHITRLAAIIFDLKQDGYRIAHLPQKRGETARYALVGVKPKRGCECGHTLAGHVGGMRCIAILNPDAPVTEAARPCPCQKFTERKEAS